MSLRDGPLNDIRPPLSWLAVAALAVAAIASLALFIGDRRGEGRTAIAGARRTAEGAIGATAGVLSAPVHWVGGVGDAARDYMLAGAQNHQLRRDLAAARSWKDEALKLRDENARLSRSAGSEDRPAHPHGARPHGPGRARPLRRTPASPMPAHRAASSRAIQCSASMA